MEGLKHYIYYTCCVLYVLYVRLHFKNYHLNYLCTKILLTFTKNKFFMKVFVKTDIFPVLFDFYYGDRKGENAKYTEFADED